MTSIERPVISLGICLGNIYRQVNVNLADRTNYNYTMLIGRDYLNGVYIVDVEIVHTTKPTCH